MAWTRRKTLERGAAVVTVAVSGMSKAETEVPMYGLISEITTASGKRDELASVLVGGTSRMPGCLSYVIAVDTGKVDTLWVTEVWVDESSHKASINLPAVQEAMRKGRPLIIGFASRVETTPIGGVGLRS